MGNLEHVLLAGFSHEPAIKLAERLINLSPKKINKIVLLDSNRYLFVGNKVPKTKGKSWINFLSADDQGEFPFEKSSMDSWLFKSDSLGNFIKEITVGDISNEFGQSVSHTKDKGYIVTGTTDIQKDKGDNFLIIRYDMFGNMCNHVRGVFGGFGYSGSGANSSSIEYITTASEGNAVFFGDLITVKNGNSGASSLTRGLFTGGQTQVIILMILKK